VRWRRRVAGAHVGRPAVSCAEPSRPALRSPASPLVRLLLVERDVRVLAPHFRGRVNASYAEDVSPVKAKAFMIASVSTDLR
jgi:hypothetical protein